MHETSSPSPKGTWYQYPWWWIATWFGCGLSPKVSGTVGSLGALPFAYFIHVYGGSSALFAASIAIFFVGWWASNQFLARTGCEHDPKDIVVDEVAGQWLLLSALYPNWQSYLLGFVLFRAFDIIKPWPVSFVDKKVESGLGVMLDDMLAGLYPVLLYILINVLGYSAPLDMWILPDSYLQSGL